MARQPRRPTKAETGGWTPLTPAVQERIVANIAQGVHIQIAAKAAGIGEATFYRWMEAGRDKTDEDGQTVKAPEPYRGFREAVGNAEAALELDLVNQYRTVSRAAAFGNASHLAGFLGRRFRGRWDIRQSVEVSGPEGGPVEVKGGSADDNLAAFLGALERAGVVHLPGDASGVPDDDGGADE